MSALDAFLTAAAAVPEVVRAAAGEWDRPSALDGWTVGGLTGHLTRAVTMVGTYLASVGDGTADLDAVGYFRSVPLRDPAMAAAVLERGCQAGAIGPERLAALVATEVAALSRSLDAATAARVIEVLGGRAIRVDEYLRTRCVELVVHRDDLSVTTTVPAFPAVANDVAFGLLLELARDAHGDAAVLRALTRRERAVPISVF